MNNVRLKKLLTAALLATFALIAFIIENLLPPLFLPGARLGLSNVFILLATLLLGNIYGYAVFITKVILGSIFTGNVTAILYSLPAGAIALTAEVILLHFNKKFGVISVSIFGGCLNLILQNVAFAIITGVWEYLAYSPYLALIGVLSGGIVGVIVYFTNAKLPSKIKSLYHLSEKENEN